jgi:hypothetical protein
LIHDSIEIGFELFSIDPWRGGDESQQLSYRDKGSARLTDRT